MISQLEVDKRNLESSLLFMQQEHSTTLKALHEEISSLQKKCRELTFQLTMQGYTESTDDQKASEKVQELEALLKESHSKHNLLEKELEHKNKKISDYKRLLKANERAFAEEMKKKDQEVLALKLELDAKGGSIAYLTTELHKVKVSQSISGRDGLLTSPPPQPPDQLSKKRSHRVTSASDIKSRPLTAKGSMPRPDAEVFLARASPPEPQLEEVPVKPTPPVLPPIAGGDTASKQSFNRRQHLIRRRVELKSQPEYSKLAVDKPASNSNTWVHEPNTTK